ncbi:hypothetical protein A2U01_0117730, partial [Trifolium medium]|nr:hypothetical protein [Trifolium medium]
WRWLMDVVGLRWHVRRSLVIVRACSLEFPCVRWCYTMRWKYMMVLMDGVEASVGFAVA